MRRVGLYLALGALCLSHTALASSKRASQRTHRVYPGQTLGMIAKRYNVSVEELCSANGITRKSPIKPQQVLIIPSKDDASSADSAALAEPEPEPNPRDAKPEQVSSARTKNAALGTAPMPSAIRPASTSHGARTPPPRFERALHDPYARRPSKRGFVTISSYTGSFRGLAVGRDGKVTDEARRAFARVLASWRTGQHESIHDRLIKMLVKVSDHFGGRPIRVVSGFRPYSPLQYTPHSRHNLGHAADFLIPGVPNTSLRDFCMTLEDVGVGYYPNSTFVHLDVRQMATYWVDYSGPGEPPRYAGARTAPVQEIERIRAAAALREPADYPALRAVDPASLGPETTPSSTDTLGAHIRGRSLGTQGSSRQVPETL